MSNQREVRPNAITCVLKERIEQLSKHGYSVQGDSTQYKYDELVRGAMYFAQAAIHEESSDAMFNKMVIPLWPFKSTVPKRHDRRSDIIRAAAMLIAEIDRIDHVEGVDHV